MLPPAQPREALFPHSPMWWWVPLCPSLPLSLCCGRVYFAPERLPGAWLWLLVQYAAHGVVFFLHVGSGELGNHQLIPRQSLVHFSKARCFGPYWGSHRSIPYPLALQLALQLEQGGRTEEM